MLTLTAESIKDYQTCARLYDYRHRDVVYEQITSDQLIDKRYENVMKNILTFLFHKKQSGNQPTYDFLVKKWQKLWFPKDTTAADIMNARIGNKSNYNMPTAHNIGVRALGYIHSYFTDDEAIPLLIGEPFIVALGKDFKITGEFDLVLKYPDHFHVIKWGASLTKTPLSSMLVDFAVLKYAFEYRNDGKPPLDVKYSFIDLALPSFKINNMEVNSEDIASIKYWSDAVNRDTVFAPRRGLTTYCRNCPFDKPCSEFKLEI